MKKLKKILIPHSKKYPDPRFMWDDGKDVNTKLGTVKAGDADSAKVGDVVTSNRKETFNVISPSFIDHYCKVKRLAQMVPLKDIGVIISNTGLGKDSVVVDAGSGSGGLALMFAHIVKKVYTYDVNEEHLDIVKKNIELLGLSNVAAEKGDIYGKIDAKDADVLTLDVPEPWKAIDNASCLKVGGFLVSYSPCITQVSSFVEGLKEHGELLHLKTVELIEREWAVDGKKVRPVSAAVGHSGFITFVRKIS